MMACGAGYSNKAQVGDAVRRCNRSVVRRRYASLGHIKPPTQTTVHIATRPHVRDDVNRRTLPHVLSLGRLRLSWAPFFGAHCDWPRHALRDDGSNKTLPHSRPRKKSPFERRSDDLTMGLVLLSSPLAWP
jgi:hypothetical protein